MKTKTFNVSRALRDTTSSVHPVFVSMKTESNRLLNGDIAVAKIWNVFRLKIIEEIMPVYFTDLYFRLLLCGIALAQRPARRI